MGRGEGGSIFPGLEKYLHAPPATGIFLSSLALSSARHSRSLVSSISAIPSPYSEVSQPAATFAPRLRFFPLSSPFLGLSVFARASRYILSYSYLALSRSVPLYPVAFWPARIGKYESFVPSALSGIRVCHGHTRETSSERGPAILCACASACDCLLAGGDKDRSLAGGARDEKQKNPSERESGRETERVQKYRGQGQREGRGRTTAKRTRCPAKR